MLRSRWTLLVVAVLLVGSSAVALDTLSTLFSGDPLIGPFSVAVSPDDTTVFVGDVHANQIFSLPIDGGVPTLIATIGPPTPRSPGRDQFRGMAISPDGATLYVAQFHFNRILAVDVASGTVSTLAPGFARPHGIAISPDGATLFVTEGFTGNILSMPAAGGVVTLLNPGEPVPIPTDVDVSPDGSTLYIASPDAVDRIFALPATGGSPVDIFGGAPTPFAHMGAVSVTPDGTHLLVTDAAKAVDPNLPASVYRVSVTGDSIELIFSGDPLRAPQLSTLSRDGGSLIIPDIIDNFQFGAVFRLQLNRPPVADPGPDRTIECAGPAGTPVDLNGLLSSDPDGDALTYSWAGPFPEGGGVVEGPLVTVTLPDGAHEVSLTVSDTSGASDTKDVTITIEDSTAPAISAISASPDTLWPPNHKMVDVTVSLAVADACGAADCRIVSVTSNERVDGTGDGNTSPDWVITGNLSAQVRAERAGRGDGRIYTLTVECIDDAGNVAQATTTVVVPKSRGR